VPRHQPVERVRNGPADPCVACERSVMPHESPAREALLGRESGDERARRGVVEREDRQPAASIDPGDDPRRPPAKASARVVQQHRPVDCHAIHSPRENAIPAAALAAPSATRTPVRRRRLS
jgi:hypothetical protein